jgi:predicted nucleic acid-binding protein
VRLLDTTILSNFAQIEQLALLAIALPDASTTPQVVTELRQGEAADHFPVSNWKWLTIISLAPDEQAHFEHIRQILDDGEASCLAVALTRSGTIFTDDRDARRYAQRLDMPVSGTLGALALLVRDRHLTLEQANALLEAMIQAGYHSPVNSLEEIYDF